MDISLKQIDCCSCGLSFWISKDWNDDLIRLKKTFYCPNGHPQSYSGDTEAEKLRKTIEFKNTIIADKNQEILDLEKKLRQKCKKPRKIKKLDKPNAK